MKPLRERLRDPADEAMIDAIERRLERSLAERSRPSRAPRLRRLALPLGAALAAAVALLVVWTSGDDGGATAVGPLLDRDGVFAGAEAEGAEPRRVSLSDGSVIVLAAGTRLDVLANTPSRVSLVLGEGEATFDVRPGGPRQWSIDAGMVAVDVLGTRFLVRRSREAAHVSVERGVVRVRGQRVPGGFRRLEAGDSVDVSSAAAPAAQVTAAPSALGERTPDPEPEVTPPDRAPRWRTLAERGDYDEAYRALGARGFDREFAHARDVATLLALGDTARLSGRPRDAINPLERVVARYPNDRRAGLAAFTLGRLRLESLSDPSAAAESFGAALRLGLPAALRESAHARLVEAHARAGEIRQAEEAAGEYEARFPEGRLRDEVRRWLRPR